MSQTLVVLSYWLHALATVTMIGHYLLLALIYLPVMTKDSQAGAGRSMLSEISKQSRVWLYLSLLVFAATGTYLTMIDPNYLGIGNFGNVWGILMLIKHLLVLAMIVIGFWFNAILRVGPMLSSNTGAVQAIDRFRFYINGMAVAGVLVLLLTALSQLQ